MAFLSLAARVLVFLLVGSAITAPAQDAPTASPSPTAAPKSVHIRFLPPPLEGTISLGIFDANGKLVRVLHREAELDEFEIGNDALSTTWDGKNDAGEVLPPGKYRARGYAVGELEVEGVGFFFNDWVTDEKSPRLAKISRLLFWQGHLILRGQTVGSEVDDLRCDSSGQVIETVHEFLPASTCPSGSTDSLAVIEIVDCHLGKDESRWVIDRLEPGSPQTQVKQFSVSGELIRELKLAPGDPQPERIAASETGEKIFLLEENAAGQRVRALELLTTKSDQGISDWKVAFEKRIAAHKDFTIADGALVLSGGSAPPDKIAVRLIANPLETSAKPSAELAVGLDENGSFLKTADGLPLQSISETPHLIRVLLSPIADKSIAVFQDDGAVVEQFRISALDQLMAFDCGEIELK